MFKKLELYPRMFCAKFGWSLKFAHWFWRRICHMYFCYFVIICILLIQGCFVPNLMEIVTVSGSRGRVSVNHFLYFVITSSSKRAGPSNENSLHPMMLCVMFVWNWSSGSGEEEEHVKSLQIGGRTDEWQTTGYQNSSLDLSAQVLKSRYTQFKLVSIFLILSV